MTKKVASVINYRKGTELTYNFLHKIHICQTKH